MKTEINLDQMTEIASRSEATVLIRGATGSGKTRLAYQIHKNSSRANKPWVSVNMASLHEGTLEAELFGHEKGAFTGADQRRVGRLESAHGGTVFLDEIGDLTPRLQARLLEFLQSRVVTPMGGNREIRLDVRVIAATHRDLEKGVAAGTFREDLFYRLRVIEINLKSIAERSEEFSEIVHTCLDEVSRPMKKRMLKISEGVAELLEAYSWPGNFRELRNVLEYALLSSSDSDSIRVEHLPSWFLKKQNLNSNEWVLEVPFERLISVMDHPSAIRWFEKNYLQSSLGQNRWRINHTARRIKMNKTTLIRRMRAYSLTGPTDSSMATRNRRQN